MKPADQDSYIVGMRRRPPAAVAPDKASLSWDRWNQPCGL